MILAQHGILGKVPEETDLFLVIGNSTSGAGTNGNTGPGPEPAEGTAYYYRRSNNTIIPIEANDLEFAADPPSNGSQWPNFTIEYYTRMRRKAVIIPTGVSSSTFSPDGVDDNNWSTTGDNYAPAVADAQAAMVITGINRLKAIFIFEGINDANGSVTLSTVQSDIASLITRLNSDFPNTPIIFCQIGTITGAQTNTRIATIRKYIKDACVANSNCYLLGGMLAAFSRDFYTDGFHLIQDGQNAIGKIFATWFENNAFGKWSRSIISSHYTDLNSNQKGLIGALDATVLSDYLNHEAIFFFMQPSLGNCYLDWTFTVVINDGISGATGELDFVANSHMGSNGTSNAARPGWVPSLSLISDQNDVFFGVKVKTVSTAVGTNATLYGGINAGTIGLTILQTNTNVIRYRINDITNTDYSTDTKFQNDTEYLVYRTGTTKGLMKNGTSVHSATQASTGLMATSPTFGANNNNGATNSFIAGEYEWLRAGKYSAVTQSTFYAFLENIRDHWND